jgi:hypothetical protein
MIPLRDSSYTVTYKDDDAQEHFVPVVARSGTHAILVAMEEVPFLKFRPNSITRITKENN